MTDYLEMRTGLLEATAKFERERFKAEKAGNKEDAAYYRRQKEQARIGFNSLRGED